MSDFNFKLKEVRKKRQLQQKDLAKKLNSSQQLISQYERGERVPSLERLIELAKILDVSLDDLIEFREIHKRYSDELSKK